MEINRIWVMPSIWTFTMKPVKALFDRYSIGEGFVDPFAGENSPAEITNDIEGRGNKFSLDALEFLKGLKDDSVKGVLFDPPYSTEQCLRRYTPKHNGTAGRAEYWAKCKDEIARITKDDGIVISFCWDSCGIGKTRGFEIIEIMLLCHGACHNDTIITVERKLPKPPEKQKIWNTMTTDIPEQKSCKICGENNGRAGLLVNKEFENCYDTRTLGDVRIHLNIGRVDAESSKTMGILN